MSESATHDAIESMARDSYGRLVAYIAARSRDIADAQDALSEALVAALESWPTNGVRDKPEAWLLHVARNRLIDASRREQIRRDAEPLLKQLAEEAEATTAQHDSFPDERLKLLFVCAHPAIDVAARTPLMLQVVLGIDAARIASAFLVSPVAMSQRLVRAKTKIRDASIPFRVPESPELSERLSFVLDAIYAAYTTGWDSLPDAASTHRALASEAIVLGRILVQLMPAEPEALGLLALMLHCEARRDARFSSIGEFIPLDQQDTTRWLENLMEEAEKFLRTAIGFRQTGHYQLEAAIQSIHAARSKTGKIDWQEIALLYEGLVRFAPSIGASVGRAVALAQADNPSVGLNALDALPQSSVVNYQPFWAARGHIMELLNHNEEAAQAFTRAANLTDDPTLRDYLLKRIDAQKTQVIQNKQTDRMQRLGVGG
jgi:RNA polymerase sigma factor (sigma-70 family)